MLTLVLNGSPRRNGDTVTLVNEMVRHLEGDVRIIDTYNADIGPCLDCRFCWDNPGCCIDDAMQEAYGLIREADNIVLASPLYFSVLTGRMLDFASRLQTYYISRCKRKGTEHVFKGKRAVIVLTGGGDTRDITPAVKLAGTVLKNMNAEPIGVVTSLKTDDIPAREDGIALGQARLMAQRLNEGSRSVDR